MPTGDDFSSQVSGEFISIAGTNAIIPKEISNKFFSLPFVDHYDDEVCAVASWDSSIHNNPLLNRLTQSNAHNPLLNRLTQSNTHNPLLNRLTQRNAHNPLLNRLKQSNAHNPLLNRLKQSNALSENMCSLRKVGLLNLLSKHPP